MLVMVTLPFYNLLLFVYVGQSEADEVQCFICEDEEEFVMRPAERVETPPKPPSPLPPPPPREKVKYTLKVCLRCLCLGLGIKRERPESIQTPLLH